MASDSVFSGMGNEAQGEEPMSPRTILSSPAGMHAQLRGKQHEEERKSLGMAQMPRRTTSTIPKEHVEGWERTRKSIAQALSGIIPREQLIEHNIPAIGADGELDPIQPAPLRHAAVARLQSAADVLLGIWDALQNVDLNRLACLRLAERCANILYAIVQEIQEMGDEVPTEIWEHLEEFGQTMTQLRNFLAQYSQRPFLKRYLKRAEILRELEEYDSLLMDSLQKFSLSVQIAILKRNQTVEMALAGKTDRLVEHISGTSELGVERGAAVALPDTEGETVDVLPLLHKLQSTQNKLDFAADTADLRAILGDALTQNNDGEILRVLQLNRENLPDTIRTLQRALEGDDAPPAYTPGVAPPEYETSNLDRKFIEGVIDALRRVTKAGGSLPAWSITRNEVQRGEHIGSGSIAQVYKGTWHGGVVAIKSLSEATPRDLFLRAADMWMPLKHPNVLKLYGANVEIGSGRMFFVCPYTPFGALDSFLRRVAENEEAKNGREGELLRFMHETAQGMEYLHDKDVIHGDLKAANVLVDARMHCVVSDFGQTEMKSEVLRINNVPPLQKDQRWYAPELLLGSSHMNHETDIYSYAMCCVEILSYGQLPWGPILDKDVKELLLKGKRRPQIPYTRPALQELLRSCWDNDPAARPPFSKIVEDTETLCEVAGISLDYLEGPDPAPSSAVSPENSRRPLPPKPSKPVLFPPLTEERRPADSSMGLGLEPLGDAMLDSESNVTAEEVQIPHSSASPVSTRSHFPILYPPKLAERLSNDPSAVRCTDTVALNNQLPVGGLLFSVHSPDAALSWLEAHYEDPLLCALRERNFEGPIAISLSADECALAIFGSISDTLVPQMAKDLAQLSGFTVMVRSSADNPIPSFTSTSSPTTLSETVRDTVSTGRAVRLRGGAGDDDDEARTTPKWEGKYHNATVDLTLKMDDDVAYDVNVVSYIKFKTQSLTNSNPTIFQPRPEVISLVSLKVKLRRGETILDRSFSNLGFLVHRPSSIVSCDFLDLGYEPPETKVKRTNQTSNSTTGGGSFGLTGIVPSFTASGSYTRGGGDSVEIADEKPMPRCNIRYDPGKSWDKADAHSVGKDFRSYDVSWLPETDRDHVAYEMHVEFGLGMYMRQSKLHKPGLPPISSILRNQIVIWTHHPKLRSKSRGVMLLTSTYVPNTLTEERLTMHESTTVNLKTKWSQDPPVGGPSEAPYDAGMSVSVAALDKSEKKKSSKLGKIINKLSFKSPAAGKLPTPALPMYETVSRGWDATNLRWRNVVWPSLDQDFQRVQNNSDAAWKLEWNTPSVQPKPATPATAIPVVTVSTVDIPRATQTAVSSTSSVSTNPSALTSSGILDKDDTATLATSLASSSGHDSKNVVPQS